MSRRLFIPHRKIALLALLAVLLHAALPFVHGLLQAPARGFYTTLCALGAPAQQIWVALDDSSPDTPEPPPRCPLCVAGAHFALQAPVTGTLALRTDLVFHQPAIARAQSLPRPASPAYQPRAPPVFSA